MTESPLVSVVVASYNHEKFIDEALDSVAEQSYPALELIVVDDQSRDGTLRRIRAWAKRPTAQRRFRRIVCERNPVNLGAHATLNRGAGLATGRFLTFLNSDDSYAPERIELLLAAIDAAGAAWGFTGVRVMNEGGETVGEPDLPPQVGFVYDGLAHARANFPSLSCALMERNFVASTGNLLVTKSLFEEVGGFRDLRYVHDWDFMLRACLLDEPIAVDTALYHYRLHGTNSFRSLTNVGAYEGACVIGNFLRMARIRPRNLLAPSSHNWPVLFDEWVERLQLAHLEYVADAS